jgi:heat shock protein HtpX
MPHVWALLESLSAQNNIPLPKLFLIENEAPNAFATGRSPKHASVAVTTGILNLLTPTELKGVLTHELSHVKNRDTLTMTITASIAGAIMWLADMARWNMLLGGQARDREDERGGGSAQLIIMLVIIVLAPIAAMLIQLAISRSREYEADHTGAKLAGNPEGLAGALLKLENSARQGVTLNASPATAHLFIMNPLHGKNWTALFSTHPPIEERVKRLKEIK